MHHVRALLLLLSLSLLACPGAADDDDDTPVQPPDDDDEEGTIYRGQVLDWYTELPVAGVTVGVGEQTELTDGDGEYVLRSPSPDIEPVDFYDGAGSVTTYADCETEHGHYVFGGAREERGGEFELELRLDGYADSGEVSGSFVGYAEQTTHYRTFGPSTPTENTDGSWSVFVEVPSAEEWAVAVSELDRSIVGWGTLSGTSLTAGSEPVVVTLSDEGLADGGWDSDTDERVGSVRLSQTIGQVGPYGALRLPVFDGVPIGGVLPVPMVDQPGEAQVEIQLVRNDLPDCGSNQQRFSVTLASVTETVVIPALFEVPRIVNGDGEGDWRFRPRIRWTGLPDDPDGYFYLYMFGSVPDVGGVFWDVRPAVSCSIDSLSWPALLEPLEPESYMYISASYYGTGRSSWCSSYVQLPAI